LLIKILLKMASLQNYIVDALTMSICKFGISQNQEQFDDDIDCLMSKMNQVELSPDDVDQQWELLKSNYSKLKYLSELINFYHLPTEGKFSDSLKVFMESIDKKTQIYLKEIDWFNCEPEFKQESAAIKTFLDDSLNQNDPVLKLSSVVKAYEVLVPIIEDMRNEEPCITEIEPSFIELFEQPHKKTKHF